jgi:predicted ATP-dependent protease
MIPASNAQHLMLRADVIEACKRGEFSIWPIETIDQGIALLTGHPVGERDADGSFPTGTVNRAVVDRLQGFLKLRKEVEAGDDERGKKR